MKLSIRIKGGRGSGHFGHTGLGGKHGGSLPTSAGLTSTRKPKGTKKKPSIGSTATVPTATGTITGKVVGHSGRKVQIQFTKDGRTLHQWSKPIFEESKPTAVVTPKPKKPKPKATVTPKKPKPRVSDATLRNDAVMYAKDITVVAKKGRWTDPSDAQIEKVAGWLENHPDSVASKVRKVVLSPTFKDFKEEANRDGLKDAKHTSAYFIGRFDKIVMRTKTKSVFDHEMGHVAWKKSQTRRSWINAYFRNANFDRHTLYSRTSIQEGFAEAYMSYIATGGVARAAPHKATFAMVEEVLNGIR